MEKQEKLCKNKLLFYNYTGDIQEGYKESMKMIVLKVESGKR